MILALDISIRSTGYFIIDDAGKQVEFGVITTTSKNTIQFRMDDIIDSIHHLINTYDITEVAIEGPAYGARGAMSYSIFGVHFCIVHFLNKLGLTPTQYSPTSVKKWATGSGRASKDDMEKFVPYELKETIRGKFKKTKGRYDIVDAYHIAKMHESFRR